jgi:heme oxygenase
MKIDKPLWEYTRDLHHACEAHDVGGAMATGNPPRIWYTAWLMALYQIHAAIDPFCKDPVITRAKEVMQDFVDMNTEMSALNAAYEYVNDLKDVKKIDGAIYVLTGAHLMGGEIMRRRLEGFPTKHLEWSDRKKAIAILQEYRTRDDIGEEARDCFQALLKIMDEIRQRYPINT